MNIFKTIVCVVVCGINLVAYGMDNYNRDDCKRRAEQSYRAAVNDLLTRIKKQEAVQSGKKRKVMPEPCGYSSEEEFSSPKKRKVEWYANTSEQSEEDPDYIHVTEVSSDDFSGRSLQTIYDYVRANPHSKFTVEYLELTNPGYYLDPEEGKVWKRIN